MLIKEYRICLPLTVDEYRIAQLYMIQKKSREESTGRGSGVEIIKNIPYENGPGGSGQYTFKIYHVASHLPTWLRNILPESALRVEEEAWNAYPYTRTIYRVPFVDKLTLDIETYYFDDDGRQDDVFKLNPDEKAARIVDYIDIVQDPVPKSDYKAEEDPVLYVSQATGRGPLSSDWRETYYHAQTVTKETHAKPPSRTPDNRPSPAPLSPLPKRIMCAYKLCRVEFRYWGMQRRIEQFIHDSALRKTMVRAHRQVWAWQDEWYGLTLEEIRRLEAETAEALANKMSAVEVTEDPAAECNPSTVNIRPNSSEPALLEKDIPEILDNPKDDDSLSFVSCHSQFTIQTGPSALDELYFTEGANDALSTDACPSPSPQGSENSEKLVLILVVHGGCLLDASPDMATKQTDFETLKRTVNLVLCNHYPILKNRFAMRLVPCASALAPAFQTLNNLKPFPTDPSLPVEVHLARDVLPLGAIPFFLVSDQPHYSQLIDDLAERLNTAYNEFLNSPAGTGFSGLVCVLADSVGGLLTYDLLNRCANAEHPNGVTVIDAGVRRWREPTFKLVNGAAEVQQTPTPAPATTSNLPNSNAGCGLNLSLQFPVQTLFLLGSPVGLILAFRKQLNHSLSDAAPSSAIDSDLSLSVDHVCNLFHSVDPCAYRFEPLLKTEFAQITPISVPSYSRQPLGDGQSTSLVETLVRHARLFSCTDSSVDLVDGNHQRKQQSQSWQQSAVVAFDVLKQLRPRWWGQQRIDYCLECPEGLRNIMAPARPAIFHASYWESKDVAAFLLRQLLLILGFGLPEAYSVDDEDAATSSVSDVSANYLATSSINCAPVARKHEESFGVSRGDSFQSTFRSRLRRQVSDSSKTTCLQPNLNVKSNHRANDILVLDGAPQTISARFAFGLLDLLSMSNEKILIQSRSCENTWIQLGTEVTDSNGRIHYRIPEPYRFGIGLHPILLVPESDPAHPVKLTMAVVPPHAEAVVFSIDGSFAASLSIMGKDPKVRAGAVDVARHWQNLGYLLIYLSARPDMQQRRVTSWLANHNFPPGITLFVDGISHDPLRQKGQLLRSVVQQVHLKLHCAYGSGKDVQLYRSLGLPAENIFIAGRVSRGQAVQSTPLLQGYVCHLTRLRSGDPVSKPASGAISASVRCFQFDLPLPPCNVRSPDQSRRASVNS